MPTLTPRDLVAVLEAHPELVEGEADRFAGYGVLGVYFPSGDVLALRRHAASSLGWACTSVWHRDRTGRWVFYQDTLPYQGCSRYFASGIDAALVAPVRVVWRDAFTFTVMVEYGGGLEWRVDLAPGGRTHLVGALVGLLPALVWERPAAVRGLGAAAGAALGAGRLRFAGRTPDAYRFLERPKKLWHVRSSRAVIGGRDTGNAIEPAEQVSLGDVWLPSRGLFAIARMDIRKGETLRPGRRESCS